MLCRHSRCTAPVSQQRQLGLDYCSMRGPIKRHPSSQCPLRFLQRLGSTMGAEPVAHTAARFDVRQPHEDMTFFVED